jgi:hypothetical protein
LDTLIAQRESVGEPAAPPLRIDIGCGSKKQPGFVGLDRIKFEGVDHVLDLGWHRWPFEDGTVAEAYTSHFVEHLTAEGRVHFCNELWRVLVPGGKCTLIVPHWASCRAYGDPTHQWPPVSEFWFYYLDRNWRADNAPHTDVKHWPPEYSNEAPPVRMTVGGFDCHFEVTWGYGMNPLVAARNAEFQQFALNNYKESIWDIHATLTKKG